MGVCHDPNADSAGTAATLTALGLILAIGAGCPSDVVDPPTLAGLRGEQGALLWSTGEAATLERDSGAGWSAIAEGPGPWWDEGATPGAVYRLRVEGVAGAALEPDGVTLELTAHRHVLLHGEGPGLTLVATVAESDASLGLRLTDEIDGELRYLDGDCEGTTDDCWSTEAVDLAPLTPSPALPEQLADGWEPRLRTHGVGVVARIQGGAWTLAASEVAVIELGRTLVWGDLHAHSNLSYDGCEQPDDDCTPRSALPGEDFFAQASERALDFAALGDHAEYSTAYPTDSPELAVDIWTIQQDLVQAAEDSGMLPLLAAEWTWEGQTAPAPDGHYRGGHKTLVFGDTAVCDAFRIGHARDEPVERSGWTYDDVNPTTAADVPEFWEALDAAEDACGPLDLLTFFHHPAYEHPQPVDWSLEDNAPDPDHEVLVEIYSEHGCSECLDLDADGCDWNIKTTGAYLGSGSVQAALSAGHQLGFVAGTDAHDARPGSVEDGPSCVAKPTGTWCQDYDGGLTGVLIAGELDRATLFDGLHARSTVATSGGRPAAAVAVLGADGQVYLPGAQLPPGAMPAELWVNLADETAVDGVEVLDGGGELLFSVEGPLLQPIDWAAPVYVRIRLDEDRDRLWFSPFFPGS